MIKRTGLIDRRVRLIPYAEEEELEGTVVYQTIERGGSVNLLVELDNGEIRQWSATSVQTIGARTNGSSEITPKVFLKLLAAACETLDRWDRGDSAKSALAGLRRATTAARNHIRYGTGKDPIPAAMDADEARSERRGEGAGR